MVYQLIQHEALICKHSKCIWYPWGACVVSVNVKHFDCNIITFSPLATAGAAVLAWSHRALTSVHECSERLGCCWGKVISPWAFIQLAHAYRVIANQMNGGNDSIETHRNSSRINAGSSIIQLIYFVTIKNYHKYHDVCNASGLFIWPKKKKPDPLLRCAFWNRTDKSSHGEQVMLTGNKWKSAHPTKNEMKEKGARKLVRVDQTSHFNSDRQVVFPHMSEKTAGFTSLPNTCLFCMTSKKKNIWWKKTYDWQWLRFMVRFHLLTLVNIFSIVNYNDQYFYSIYLHVYI